MAAVLQQSYVIDKRITPRFIAYERADLAIGIVVVIVGAAAMMCFTAAAFAGRAGVGNFTDAGGIASGLGHNVGPRRDPVAVGLIEPPPSERRR